MPLRYEGRRGQTGEDRGNTRIDMRRNVNTRSCIHRILTILARDGEMPQVLNGKLALHRKDTARRESVPVEFGAIPLANQVARSVHPSVRMVARHRAQSTASRCIMRSETCGIEGSAEQA